ncbi:MAG: glycosyltransferase [Rikenellaceae bacterium]
MIPKKLHYVWVGGKEIPEKFQLFISLWRKIMPDWEIIEWNELNFDINENDYCKEAYRLKKWAFVSDYIRLKVLYLYGGIYLDIDMQMIRSLEPFSKHTAFFGLEYGSTLQAGVFGCKKEHPIFRKILDYYDKLEYIVEPSDSTTVIGQHMFNVLKTIYPDLVLKEEIMEIDKGVFIYPSSYFCPDLANLEIKRDSYTIHWGENSWQTPKNRFKSKIYQTIVRNRVFGAIYRLYKR